MASNPASCHLSRWGPGALFHLPSEGVDGDGYGIWEDAGLHLPAAKMLFWGVSSGFCLCRSSSAGRTSLIRLLAVPFFHKLFLSYDKDGNV